MLALLVPVGLAILGGTAYVVATQPKKGAMTPERQTVLDTALQSTAEPDKLRALAKVFRDEGLPLQAELLEKRAKLRELPPDVKEGRKAAFRAGMASLNPAGIRLLADEFEKEGATGAAAALRTYAFSLDNPLVPPGTGTVDGKGTGVIPEFPGFPSSTPIDDVAQQAVKLVDQSEQPLTAAQVAQNAATAIEAARIEAINAAIDAGDHPESSAVAENLARIDIFQAPVNQ